MKKNPKTHDSLMKWLIASFTEEFFAHFFPNRVIGKYTFVDKEFISKYEALKESIKDDLFIMMEMEIDGELNDVLIQIEHKSKRLDVSKQIYKYHCYAWLLREKPVWSIAIFTDDAIWRKKVPDTFWCAFSDKAGKQLWSFDVIKIKDEKSNDLIKKHSMMCKLLALKADDTGVDREYLIREIYTAANPLEDVMDNDKKLLLEQWVDAYRKVPKAKVKKIKEEIKMSYVATTITEHYIHQGQIIGEEIGEKRGEKRGEIKGKIEMLDNFLKSGIIPYEKYQDMLKPLMKELEAIELKLSKPSIDEVK